MTAFPSGENLSSKTTPSPTLWRWCGAVGGNTRHPDGAVVAAARELLTARAEPDGTRPRPAGQRSPDRAAAARFPEQELVALDEARAPCRRG